MSAVNVTIVGNVGHNPVLRVSNSGVKWTSIRVATTRRQQVDGLWTDGPTIWFEVKAFGSKAQNAVESLEKGTPVVVVGRLGVEEFDAARPRDNAVDSGIPERRSALVIQNATIAVDLSRGVAKWQKVIHTDVVMAREPLATISTLEPPRNSPFSRDDDDELTDFAPEFERELVAA